MSTAAKTTSRALATLKDPTGRRRASARRRLMVIGAVAGAGSLVAAAATARQRRRADHQHEVDAPADEVRATARPAATKPSVMAAGGDHRSGAGARPGGGHLGFGVGGSIPAGGPAKAARTIGRMGDAMPTAGGDALGGTVRGGEEVGYADEIVTGAGEAISNSTTPAQNGHGPLH